MKYIPLKYMSEQGEASALAIMNAFDPEWKSGSFSVKHLSELNVNTVRLRSLPSHPGDLTIIVCLVAQVGERGTWVRNSEVFPFSIFSGVSR